MKPIIKQLLRERLLIKEEIFNYNKIKETTNGVTYSFNADGLIYIVDIYPSTSYKEYYDVSFYIKNEDYDDFQNYEERINKGVNHLNNVLQTVSEIVERVISDMGITKLTVRGHRDDKDSDDEESSSRAKIYARFLNKKYPNSVRINGDDIFLDIKQ